MCKQESLEWIAEYPYDAPQVMNLCSGRAWRFAFVTKILLWLCWAACPAFAYIYSSCSPEGHALATLACWQPLLYAPFTVISIYFEYRCMQYLCPVQTVVLGPYKVGGRALPALIFFPLTLCLSAAMNADMATSGIFLGRLLRTVQCEDNDFEQIWRMSVNQSAAPFLPNLAMLSCIAWALVSIQMVLAFATAIPRKFRIFKALLTAADEDEKVTLKIKDKDALEKATYYKGQMANVTTHCVFVAGTSGSVQSYGINGNAGFEYCGMETRDEAGKTNGYDLMFRSCTGDWPIKLSCDSELQTLSGMDPKLQMETSLHLQSTGFEALLEGGKQYAHANCVDAAGNDFASECALPAADHSIQRQHSDFALECALPALDHSIQQEQSSRAMKKRSRCSQSCLPQCFSVRASPDRLNALSSGPPNSTSLADSVSFPLTIQYQRQGSSSNGIGFFSEALNGDFVSVNEGFEALAEGSRMGAVTFRRSSVTLAAYDKAETEGTDISAMRHRIAVAGRIQKSALFILTSVVLDSCVQINLQATVLAIEFTVSGNFSRLTMVSILLSLFSGTYTMIIKGLTIKQLAAAMWPHFSDDDVDVMTKGKVQRSLCMFFLCLVYACFCVALALYSVAKLEPTQSTTLT